MNKNHITILVLSVILVANLNFCSNTNSEKDDESQTNLALLAFLSSRNSQTQGLIESSTISYDGKQSGNQGSDFGFIINTEITSMTPSITGTVPISYSISKDLPAGLTFSTTTGTISGTPNTVSSVIDLTVSADYAGTTSKRSSALDFLIVANAAGITAITCNQTGNAAGCATPTAPYSCSNSASCFTSLTACRDSGSCASF